MLTYIIAIRDIVADTYTQPSTTASIGGAIREFQDACKDKSHYIGKHPEHYELWVIGTFDDHAGEIGVYAGEFRKDRKQLASGANFAD